MSHLLFVVTHTLILKVMLAHFVSFEGYAITIYYIITNSCVLYKSPYDVTCIVVAIDNVLTMFYMCVCVILQMTEGRMLMRLLESTLIKYQ